MKTQLDQAIENVRSGFYDDARRSLLQLVRQNPHDELAWLWLAQALDDPQRQLDCLRQVLRINPNNRDALEGMEALRAGRPLPEPGGVVVVTPEAAPESAPPPFIPAQPLSRETLFEAAPTVAASSAGAEETPPATEPPSMPETETAPESFLQRARRMRMQGFSVPTTATSPEGSSLPTSPAPYASPFMEATAEETAAAPTPTPTSAPPSRFRLFDRRVFFSLLGLIELPLLIALGVLFLRERPGALPVIPVAMPQTARSTLKACRDLDLTAFTPAETLGGALTADTIFSGTQAMITETLVVPEERRLFISPGATLIFSPGTTIEVYGVLYACGDEDAPITFTAHEKTPGGWEGIRLYNPHAASVFNFARIDYAGERALYLFNSVPLLSDFTIANSALFAISSDGSALPTLAQNVNLSDNPVNGIEIRSGTLEAASIVWPPTDFVYVVSGPVWVDEEATLDIQPGAIVKFWQRPRGQLPGIWVRGLLQADGVQFTSIYDSRAEVGGNTYREAIDPHPGDWGSLTFYESSAKSYLRHTTVRYGGHETAAILIKASSPELTQVTISDSAGYPLSSDPLSFPLINTLTLTGNRSGDALEIYGSMTITGEEEWTWDKLGGDVPLARVVHGTITVGPHAKLTIQPGVVVKFTAAGGLVVKGALSAVGGATPEEKIIFTSVHDDEYGGDIDGVTTAQDSRAWGGIRLEGVDATTDLQNVMVRYAPVTLVDAAPKLANVQLYATSGAGLQMTPASSPMLQTIQFEGNGIRGIAVLTGTIKTDQSWALLGRAMDQVVRVLEGEVTVAPNAVLKIDPGVVIKADAAGKLTVLGHLNALGHSNQEIVFTSLHDDTAGDTNNRLLNPGSSDWPGIDIGPEANAHLAYVSIYYAQVGLTVQGNQLPTIDVGRVYIAHSRQPLACTARMQISPVFLFENNDIAVTRCPSP
ncbi:MAG TPA: hypothetical protein PLH19_00610 [Anaerolineae bacterium]|nr:hypothetical protein [Anaerolineae bacterium]HQH37020.1 hypothetical protein [Anaerolineae bacterium]